MTGKQQLKQALAKIKQQQAEDDAKVNEDMTELADGTGRLKAHLNSLSPKEHRATVTAMERHRQREVAKGKSGW